MMYSFIIKQISNSIGLRCDFLVYSAALEAILDKNQKVKGNKKDFLYLELDF